MFQLCSESHILRHHLLLLRVPGLRRLLTLIQLRKGFFLSLTHLVFFLAQLLFQFLIILLIPVQFRCKQGTLVNIRLITVFRVVLLLLLRFFFFLHYLQHHLNLRLLQ